MKMILPLGEVPEHAVVTKRTGEKRYRVRDTFSIWGIHKEDTPEGLWSEPKDGARTEKQEFHAGEGARFLVPESGGGDVNALGSDIEVVWIVTREDLEAYLAGLEDSGD